MNDFSRFPEQGKFTPWTIVLTILLLISAFIGIGQLPLTWAILKKMDNGSLAGVSQTEIVDSLGENYFLVLVLIPFVVALGMMYLSFRYIHHTQPLRMLTNRPQMDFKRIILAAALWGGLLFLMQIILLFTGAEMRWNFNSDTFWELLLISLFILPLQTTCEELIFRSYLFKTFSFLSAPFLQIVVCALLFGLLHISNPEVMELGAGILIFYTWTGIFLGVITQLDDGMELAIGYHAVNNIFAAVIVSADWQAFKTDALWLDMRSPSFSWELWATLFLVQPLLILIFGSIYKWDWRKLRRPPVS